MCLAGDSGTWTWRFDRKEYTADNPVFLAKLKAKRLKELLQRQRSSLNPRDVPFVAPAVFCSAPDLAVQLTEEARAHVYGRDGDNEGGKARSGLTGIIARLTMLPRPPDAAGKGRKGIDSDLAKALEKALDGAGIRPSQKSRRVGDYVLERLLVEGNLYQDWLAVHRSVPDMKRRIRIYGAEGSGTIPKETVDRAARRELDLLKLSLIHI